MNKLSAQLVNLYSTITAFIISAKKHVPKFIEGLKEMMGRAKGRVKEALALMLGEAETFMQILDDLEAKWILLGKRVGVAIEKLRMGVKLAKENVLVLIDKLRRIIENSSMLALELLGRGVYLRIKEEMRRILENPGVVREDAELEATVREAEQLSELLQRSEKLQNEKANMMVE